MSVSLHGPRKFYQYTKKQGKKYQRFICNFKAAGESRKKAGTRAAKVDEQWDPGQLPEHDPGRKNVSSAVPRAFGQALFARQSGNALESCSGAALSDQRKMVLPDK